MRLNLFKKLVLVLVLASLFSGFVPLNLLSQPKTAKALITVPIVAPATNILLTAIKGTLVTISGSSGITAGQTSAETTQTILEWGLKIAGQIVKKQILDRLVDALIDWIQGGGKGRIVDDWGLFFETAGQNAVGEFAKAIGLEDLCSPFAIQFQLALFDVRTFSEQVTCTLDDIITNLDNFYNDFTAGGWLGYQTLWQPQNNFFGLTLMGLDRLAKEEALAVEAAKSEALAGQGFLSTKDASGRIITPGALLGDAARKVLIDSPIDAILSADDVAAYITAIGNAAVNQLTKAAVDGILGLGKSSDITSAAPITFLSSDVQDAAAAADVSRDLILEQNKGFYIGEINFTLLPRQNADALFNETLAAQTSLVTALQDLDACSPSDSSVQDLLTDPQKNLPDLIADEQEVLTQIQVNQVTNLNEFVTPLGQAANDIDQSTSTNNITLIYSDVFSLLSPVLALGVSNAVQETKDEILLKTDTADPDSLLSKILDVADGLSGCEIIITP